MKILFLICVALLAGLTKAGADLQQFCLGKRLNEVIPHPLDCRGFIMCSEKPTAQYCEEGFHFDMKGMVCNWPEKVNCRITTRQVEKDNNIVEPALTSLEAFDIKTGQVVSPMLDYNPNQVACRHFGAYFLPSPRTCRAYYLCAYGHMHEHACGSHTLWDYKMQQCVLSHQAVCYTYNQEEEKELNVALGNIKMVCYPVNTTSFSNETDPVTSTAYVATPAATTTITTTTLPTPPTLSIGTTTTRNPTFSNPYNITCPLKRQSYVAHPEDCSKYYMCIMGTAVMTACPKGLMWDAKKSYCDILKNVKCFADKTAKETEPQTVVI